MLKPFKFFFRSFICLSFFLLSCTPIKKETKALLKVGDQVWTYKEVKNYMEFRLSDFSLNSDLEEIKALLLKELLFQSLLKTWAKDQKIQKKKTLLNKKDLLLFPRDSSKLKALKQYKNFVFLNQHLMNFLKKQIPQPSLKEQKRFYKKNKALFKQASLCYLKQILVSNQKLAQALYKQLKTGETSFALAKSYSLQKDPGWIQTDQWDLFEKACKSESKLNKPVKSDYGYHIFLRTEVKPAKQKSFLESQKEIVAVLKEKNLPKKFQNWLKQESLKKSFWIDKKGLDKIKIQYKTKE